MRSKYFKKIISIFTAVCMVISLWAITGPPATSWADDPPGGESGGGGESPPWEGSGTSGDPYLISDDTELVALSDPEYSNCWGAYFEQTANITLPAITSGSNWTPIGDGYSNAFTGTYDGRGFTISNLTINDGTLNAVGLFGYASGVLKNITLEGVSVVSTRESGSPYVGGLVGNHIGAAGIIERCSVSGNVQGASGAEVGGIAGMSNAVIRFSSSSGTVRGTDNVYCVGGIVGFNYGTVEYSSSSAVVTVGNNDAANAWSHTYAGGLIGYGGEVHDSYSIGSVTAGNNEGSSNICVGGLVGGGGEDIENCYSIGAVAAGDVNGDGSILVGGLATDRYGNSEVTDSYFNSETSGTTEGIGTPKTTDEMKTPSLYSGWDPGAWYIEAGAYPVLTGQRTEEFAGGNGTYEFPYQVATAAHLDNVRDYLDACFIQTADITLPDAAPGGSNWTPIGDYSDPFEGTYDGGGHTISGLTISSSAISHAGLFGYLSGGELINIGLEDVSINVSAPGSSADVGGLVGCIGSGDVDNSYSTGEVTGSGDYARVGGLVGFNEGGYVDDSYSTANVTGNGAYAYAGGLAGYNERDNGITNCYSAGNVSGTSTNKGGLIGGGDYLVEDSYYDADASGQSDTDRGTPISSAEMKRQASYVDWDFGGIWLIAETLSYPVLAWQVSFEDGDGSEDEPYEVETILQLNKVRSFINNDNVHFLQTGNITLPVTGSGSNWTPIGANSGNSFTGAYDGNGYTISNLIIDDDTMNYVGLFGYVGEDGAIQDITLENASIRLEGDSWLHAGALAGSNEGSISGSGSGGGITCIRNSDFVPVNIGGLVGSNDGTVEDSYSSCNIDVISENTISIFAGGLIGFNTGNITGSYSSGDVTVEAANADPCVSVGGLAGSHDEGSIEDSYSTGNVSVDTVVISDTDVRIGGLVGYQYANISNTYSSGTVTGGESADIGGLVGHTDAGSITGSYYDSDVSGLTASAAGITPLYTEQMKQEASFVDWDFTPVTGVWRILENQSYPLLQWQGLTADEAITLDTAALDWNAIKGDNSAEDNITADLTLPAAGTNGSIVTWSADPAGYVNTAGGAVTRPAYGSGDKNVTLSAIVSKAGGTSQTREFTLTVKEAPYSGGNNNNDSDNRAGGGTGTPPPIPAPAVSEKLEIPAGFLTNPAAGGTMTLNSNVGSIVVPSNMLVGIAGAEGKKAEIIIGQGDKENLPEDVKEAIGDRPLISLSLALDGVQTDWSNPGAPVTVSVPYTPTAEELANPEGIVVWYIDGSGNVVSVPNGRYDPATGAVIFDVTHFSNYAVVYNKVSFGDVPAGAWYHKAVSFIAARDITTGTGGGSFSPQAKLTRGQFIVMLMKAYEIAPAVVGSGGSSTDADGSQANAADPGSFSDAGNTYYTGYLATAKRMGISGGVGNNMFAPEKQTTRQEMFTLLYNALKVIGQLPQASQALEGGQGMTLSDFSDADQVASWAADAMTLLIETETIAGSGGKLNPAGTTTRAEMAQVLYNLMSE